MWLAILLILAHCRWTHGLVPQEEIDALHELYSQTQGDNWDWKDETIAGPRWNFSNSMIIDPCCDSGRVWQGLTCSLSPPQCCVMTCQITAITLSSFRLKGKIDSVSWGQLQNVTTLDLAKNQLSGHFPFNLTLMSSLENLDVSITLLSSTLPTWVGSFKQIEYLDLNYARLTGPIPSQIGSLTTLQLLRLSANSFTALPSTIGELQRLVHLEAYSNQFKGRFPAEICRLTNLEYFAMYYNGFTGSLPSDFASMMSLTFLSFDSNRFEGSILPLTSLSKLRGLAIQRNRFSGTIPSEISSLIHLRDFYLYQNHFTGQIPTEMEACTSLQNWFCWGNGLYGSIPSFFGSLLDLKEIDFASNYFVGPIPPIQRLTKLDYLNFNRNYLTGPIPSGIGSLNLLNDLQMTLNHLTSTLPPSLSLLTRLTKLNFRENALHGPLPSGLGNLTNLGQLYLQGNRLTGTIHNLFRFSDRMQLTHLDLSDNQFSGQIPDSLFHLSLLSTLALTSNCFHGNIPPTICNAKEISVLSMDGLCAAKHCVHKQRVPITNIPIGYSLNGDIPECIWNLRNLTVLSLTANGLTGSLPSIPLDQLPPLVNLSLSHNHLTGTVPKSFQTKSFLHLDLSNNKFSGEYPELGTSVNPEDPLDPASKQAIYLDINRFSGKLPSLSSSLSSLLHLNILTGNVFACDQLPTFDVDEDTYHCGSNSYDNSLYALVVVVGIGVIGILIYLHLLSPRNPHHLPGWHEIRSYFSVFSSDDFVSHFPTLHSFITCVTWIGRTVIGVSLLSIVLFLPLYIWRQSSDDATSAYSTHSHLYRWAWSTAYLSGLVPAIWILCVWFGLVLATLFGAYTLLIQRTTSTHVPHTETTSSSWRDTMLATVFVFFNMAVVGTINGLYIYSTFRKQSPTLYYLIQLALALFKWFWNVIFIPTFILLPFTTLTHKSFLRITLFLLNNVVIPSIAAMLTSPSCYRGLLVEPDEIVSTYSFQTCDTTAILTVDEVDYSICVSESTSTIDVAPLTPPFSYNYLCASTVLTAYIPVYLYIYCIEILLPVLSLYLLLFVFPKYHTLPPFLVDKVPAVLWIDFPEWLNDQLKNGSSSVVSPLSSQHRVKNGEVEHTDLVEARQSTIPTTLFKPDGVFIPLLQHLAILLTFGMNSPALGLAIALAISVLILQLQWLTSRFVSHLNHFPAKGPTMQLLTQSFFDPTSNILLNLWLIIGVSCVFISALCWDIAGDERGWNHVFWIPLLGFALCLLLFAAFQTFRHCFLQSSPQPRSSSPSQASRPHQSEVNDHALPVGEISMHHPTLIQSQLI
jgi:Leucine-rich repeat (LRR) protein